LIVKCNNKYNKYSILKMIRVDIISHNVPGSEFRRNDLSTTDFIVYSNENSFRVYFLKKTFKTICHIIYQKLELDDHTSNHKREDEDNVLLKMIFGPRKKKISIEIGLYSEMNENYRISCINSIKNCSDFLKLVIEKID
jgi:hypothetical protein